VGERVRPAELAMTIETRALPGQLTALPTDLPPVERRAVIPQGFVAAGATCGIKASGRPDLAVIAATDRPAAAAAVFTQNAFAAAPVRLSQAHLAASEPAGNGSYGWAQGVISTSGSANAATGPAGDADQAAIAALFAHALGTTLERTLCMSTGIIGTRLPLDRVALGIAAIVGGGQLSAEPAGLEAAAEALRTTDSRAKLASVSMTMFGTAAGGHGGPFTVSGIAKGVGMIHPRMATMLSVVLTDAAVDPATLHDLLRRAAARTWNQLSVDGDTSTNDTVIALASGASGVACAADSPAAELLGRAIEAVARDLARQQATDGEGATTLLTCQVSGARDDADARAVARAVISSSLVKAAAHGRDPNWGRVAGAAGNADAEVDPATLRIAMAGHLVYDGPAGGPVAFDRAAARAAMEAPEVLIRLDLGLGTGTGEAFGCDLTEQYVIENSEYTT
jgi:glutamate N-acetyltransferase/amino-acid N-acetyltransferase